MGLDIYRFCEYKFLYLLRLSRVVYKCVINYSRLLMEKKKDLEVEHFQPQFLINSA